MDSAPAPACVPPPQELAARLASKLCHDFISPAGAIIAGLDLLDDPAAAGMREEAMELIASSARKLVDLIAFARAAFGAAATSADFDRPELERLTQALYAHTRAELEWAQAPDVLPGTAAQVLLGLAQLAAGALPRGGTARIEAAEGEAGWRIEADAQGPRAGLQAETLAGLLGEPLVEGVGGRWAPAAYLHAVVAAAGGAVEVESAEDRVTLRATLPA